MNERAKQVYEELFAGASSIVAEGLEHTPIMFVYGSDGPAALAMDCNCMPKDIMAALHRCTAEREGVAVAALVFEAWTVEAKARSAKAAEEKAAKWKGSLEHVKGRKEAIVFSIRAGGEQYLAQCVIDRGSKSLSKGELLDVKALSASGRFVGHGNRKVH